MDPILSRLAESMGSARTLEELVRPLLEMLEAATGLESTYLTLIDTPAGLQHILYARNTAQLQIPEGLSVPWGDTLCKRALDEGRLCTDDVPSLWGDSDAARALGIRTYASAAVRLEGGAVYGTLCGASAESRPLDARAEQVLRLFAHLIGRHVEREQLLDSLQAANAELAARALVDPLTGLSNRRALLPELSRMLARVQRDDRVLMVAFIDLDRFKQVNDTHGHAAGDALLVAVASAISGCLRAGDLLARIGDDEFVVAATLPREAAERASQVLAGRLAACTAGRFDAAGTVIDYDGASIGTVLALHGEVDAEEILARADAAMYAVKRGRRA